MKTCILTYVKALRLTDHNRPHISNIGSVMIDQALERGAVKKVTFSTLFCYRPNKMPPFEIESIQFFMN